MIFLKNFWKNIWLHICSISRETNKYNRQRRKWNNCWRYWKKREKVYEQDKYSKFVIEPAYKRGDLKNAIKIILETNELLTLDEDSNDR